MLAEIQADSWLDADVAPLLTWKRGDAYHQISMPHGYTVCAIKLDRAQPYGYEAWRGRERLFPWTLKAADARQACQDDAIAVWRRYQRIGA